MIASNFAAEARQKTTEFAMTDTTMNDISEHKDAGLGYGSWRRIR
jgi:hypothetical protein